MKFPVLDRLNQDLINRLATEGGPPVYALTPDKARNALLRMQSGFVRKPDAQVKNLTVNCGQYAVRLRTIHPDRAMERGPVIIYFHGAGWVMGDSTTHDRLVRELAVSADATVVFGHSGPAPFLSRHQR